MARIIDTHQHLWEPLVRTYAWLEEEDSRDGPLYRSFTPADIEPQLRRAGVECTVLVQSADTYEDTFSMLAVADEHDFVAGVVGWVPLDRNAEAAAALDRLTSHAKFKGMRQLIHTYADPDWIIQPEVITGLKMLAARDFTFDLVAVLPRHLEHAATLAKAVPDLRIVIDHLAKPRIAEKEWEPWAGLLGNAAAHPNVYAKLSGLNTAADLETWTAADLQPYINYAIDQFTPDRLMYGGDWPITTLAGGYQKVWDATQENLAGLSPTERDAILGGTAQRVYRLTESGED